VSENAPLKNRFRKRQRSRWTSIQPKRVRMRFPNFNDQAAGRIFLESKINLVCGNIDFGNCHRLQEFATRHLLVSTFRRSRLLAVAMHLRPRSRCFERNQAAQRAMIRNRKPCRHRHDNDEKPVQVCHSTNHDSYLISPIPLMFKRFIETVGTK
jgi:hypothetical protein